MGHIGKGRFGVDSPLREGAATSRLRERDLRGLLALPFWHKLRNRTSLYVEQDKESFGTYSGGGILRQGRRTETALGNNDGCVEQGGGGGGGCWTALASSGGGPAWDWTANARLARPTNPPHGPVLPRETPALLPGRGGYKRAGGGAGPVHLQGGRVGAAWWW